MKRSPRCGADEQLAGSLSVAGGVAGSLALATAGELAGSLSVAGGVAGSLALATATWRPAAG